MPDLTRSSFSDFMRETTGFAPFPWQTRLLDSVLADPERPGWPALLDLPTGTGKTSTLHVAVFALAMRPEVMPRRIVLVVDRRIIVDQVHGVANRLADHLASATDGVSAIVAGRLRSLCASDSSVPLRASLLRGGIPRDDAWIEAPEQPTIFASTVDQVGSRLLFRGYGVSPGMRPVHAGIVGRDTLYLLDEVHLATAFEKTLSDVARYSEARWREHSDEVGRPIRVVCMSATPRSTAQPESIFRLDEDDRAQPLLAERLRASRPARLQLVKTKSNSNATAKTIAAAATKSALQLTEGGARLVGVVMNRVATAVKTARMLEDAGEGRVLLITGRMRPFDRSRIQAEIEALAASGAASETQHEGPSFVVATSCIEAGADYDFDGLVTEVASLPALRQRFGRLNRLGRHPSAAAWILGSKHQLSKRADPDPIYGEALANTWNFLESVAKDGQVDFGLEAFPEVEPSVMETLRTADAKPPTMFPGYLDLWSETRPAPHPDPEVTLWLHGKDQDPERDVSVVFRADVEAPTSHQVPDRVRESLEFIPPLSEEAVSVPLWKARDFIEDRSDADDARVLRWTSEGPEAVGVRELSVGDVLVVPAAWGGLSQGSWDATSRVLVEDVAEQVYLSRAGARHGDGGLLLRVTPEVLAKQDIPRPPSGENAEDTDAWDAAREALASWLTADIPAEDASWSAELRRKANSGPYLMHAAPDHEGRGWLVSWRLDGRGLRTTTDDAVSSFSGMEVTLSDHLDDVRAWARGFAERAGISDAIAQDVALAAWLHDIGKADSRFQVLLRGGDPIAAHAGPNLAKSAMPSTPRLRARARQRSAWPVGFRHELISLALFEAAPSLRDEANDPELVRHLIASHHGWCRPWSPSIDDPLPQRVRLDLGGQTVEADTNNINDELRFGAASRFRRLCRRYGWHGLAYLEALLRLGDHQASRAPATRPKEAAQ